MYTGRYILASTLILVWGLILSARCLAAATYASTPVQPYSVGLYYIGWFLPLCAWVSLGFGLIVLRKTWQLESRETHRSSPNPSE